MKIQKCYWKSTMANVIEWQAICSKYPQRDIRGYKEEIKSSILWKSKWKHNFKIWQKISCLILFKKYSTVAYT